MLDDHPLTRRWHVAVEDHPLALLPPLLKVAVEDHPLLALFLAHIVLFNALRDPLNKQRVSSAKCLLRKTCLIALMSTLALSCRKG